MNDKNEADMEFEGFINGITQFFEEAGIEIVSSSEVIEEDDQDSTSKSQGFKSHGFLISGDNVPEALKEFIDSMGGEVEVLQVSTNDQDLLRSLQTLKMFQEYKGMVVPSNDEDFSTGTVMRPADLPAEVTAHLDSLAKRKEEGEEIDSEESAQALKEMVVGIMDWMVTSEENPKIKQLMELMLYRINTGSTSPASDQAIISLFDELNKGDLDNHATEVGVAMHHMATHHTLDTGTLDLDVSKTTPFKKLNGLLNTKGEIIHGFTHALMKAPSDDAHDFLHTMMMSLYIEGMMTGWYAAKDAQHCLGAETHGK